MDTRRFRFLLQKRQKCNTQQKRGEGAPDDIWRSGGSHGEDDERPAALASAHAGHLERCNISAIVVTPLTHINKEEERKKD
jgi:hypothetical protein